ncbi:uncharacterized protein LOC127709934 [Mytilus californianus]|uniref:uncharacterized protein LOC127709934 n=1 Tax=Mytilus californianus TaxID=6549 RepID=UPI0022453928|nr:uncharacterized protein LOC127709934 [Mytilus californianus]XP_052071606.1 uncharacterized protein LOC127709934 [Mytilus californianus]
MPSRNFIYVVDRCNNFLLSGSSKLKCLPFFVRDKQVGIIRPDILPHLQKYQDVFITSPSMLKLSDDLKTLKERSEKVQEVLTDLREQKVLVTLNGWRNETFDIRTSPKEKAYMEVERSGICLFGAISYGVHVNGYIETDNQLMMWIARRSPTKPTYPNKLDNMCAGGLASGLKVRHCAIKECEEEASIPKELTDKLVGVGCVSYILEDKRGVFPECEYLFDLKLPTDYQPVNADGEVGAFELMSIDQVMDAIVSDDFKPNSALIMLDFLVRHGFVTPENEKNYAYLVEMMHVPLQSYFANTTQMLSR